MPVQSSPQKFMNRIENKEDRTLVDRFGAGRFVITAEVVPPVSCDPADLLKKALPLRKLADAVNVTDSTNARAHLSSLAAAAILIANGFEPILQITCRDRNRIALQSDLLGAAALGLRNLLLLRGDHPSAGDQPEAKPVFDLDSPALIETARRLRDRGELPSGRTISGRPRFLLGAADTPIDPPAGWSPDALIRKIAAGAQFAQTQFCMDAGIVRRYVRCLADSGVPATFHLLIGVAPLRSAGSARWMRHNLPGTIIPDAMIKRIERAVDPKAEGKRMCVEYLEEIADIPGVAGAHLMAPGNEAALPEVIAHAERIARRRMPA
jgi:methylenetetrahydrofolate reductase (NADPH)